MRLFEICKGGVEVDEENDDPLFAEIHDTDDFLKSETVLLTLTRW